MSSGPKVGSKVDGLALALLSDQLSSYLRVREGLHNHYAKFGTYELVNGDVTRAHPLLGTQSTIYGNILKLLVQYGLTAASRANVQADLDSGKDPIDAFLDG